MPGRAVKTQKHAVTGKYVSAKSKTGNPQCSQAMSTWVRGRSSGSVPAEVFAILGKCRAQAHALKSGHLQRVAGNEARAQVLEHRAATGKVGAKNRSELAARLREQRAAKQTASKPSLKAQVQAHREKMGIADPNVRLRKSIDLKQGLNARHERAVQEKDKYIDSVHKDLTTRSQDLRDTSGAKYLKSSAEKALGDRNRLAKERGLPERGPLDFRPKAIKRTVHEAIHELSGGKPATKVSIDKLKSHIKNVHKKEIDTALQHLAKKGHVTIHDGKHVTAQRPAAPFDRAAEAKRLIEQRKAAKTAQAKPAVASRATPERSALAKRLREERASAIKGEFGKYLNTSRPSQRISARGLLDRRSRKIGAANDGEHTLKLARKELDHTKAIYAKRDGDLGKVFKESVRKEEKAIGQQRRLIRKKIEEKGRYLGLRDGDRRNFRVTEVQNRLSKIKAAKDAKVKHIDRTHLRFSGKTYDWKNTLKSRGAKFDEKTSSWVLPKNALPRDRAELKKFVRQIRRMKQEGVKVSREGFDPGSRSKARGVSRASAERSERARILRNTREKAQKTVFSRDLGVSKPTEKLSAQKLLDRRLGKLRTANYAEDRMYIAHRDPDVISGRWEGLNGRQSQKIKDSIRESKAAHKIIQGKAVTATGRLGGPNPKDIPYEARVRAERVKARLEQMRKSKAQRTAAKTASPTPSQSSASSSPPATPRAASNQGYKIHLTGNTYAHRDHIKSLGARWSKEHQAWIIDPKDHDTMKGRGRLSAALHELKRKGVHHDYV